MLHHLRVGGKCRIVPCMNETCKIGLVHQGTVIIPSKKIWCHCHQEQKTGLWECIWMNWWAFGPMHQGTAMIPHKKKWCNQSLLPTKNKKGIRAHICICQSNPIISRALYRDLVFYPSLPSSGVFSLATSFTASSLPPFGIFPLEPSFSTPHCHHFACALVTSFTTQVSFQKRRL